MNVKDAILGMIVGFVLGYVTNAAWFPLIKIGTDVRISISKEGHYIQLCDVLLYSIGVGLSVYGFLKKKILMWMGFGWLIAQYVRSPIGWILGVMFK